MAPSVHRLSGGGGPARAPPGPLPFPLPYPRGLRGKAGVHSALEDIPGVGPARRRALLQYFKSIKAIREAGLEEIKKVPGVNAPAAEAVFAWAHPEGANAEA